MPSIARIILSSAILLGFVALIEWGAWRSMVRMWSRVLGFRPSVGVAGRDGHPVHLDHRVLHSVAALA